MDRAYLRISMSDAKEINHLLRYKILYIENDVL